MTTKISDFIFFVGMTLLSIGALGYGVAIIPSPTERIQHAFDTQRIDDLEEIQQAIATYASDNDKLPEKIADVLQTDYSYAFSLTDPETKKTYDYQKINTFTYKLCAIFVTDTTGKAPSEGKFVRDTISYDKSKFSHPKGHFCFEETIPYLQTPPTPTTSPRVEKMLDKTLQIINLDADLFLSPTLTITPAPEIKDN